MFAQIPVFQLPVPQESDLIAAYAPENGSKEYQSILPLYSVELEFLDDNPSLPDFGRVASVSFTHSARLYDKVRQFIIAAFRKEM